MKRPRKLLARILSMAITAAMAITMLPTTVSAAEAVLTGTTKEVNTKESWSTAFTNAQDGDTIKVTADIDLDTNITIDGSKAITLDLNGKTVTFSAKGRATITMEGSVSLTVTDGSSTHLGKLEVTGSDAITNYSTGAVTVTGGTVEATAGSAINNYKGSVDVSGGIVRSADEYGRTIYNASTAAVTISGGTVEATGEYGETIFNYDTGAVMVAGGTVEATGESGRAITNINTGAVTVSGGTVEATGESGTAICNNTTGIITISGTATVTSKNTSDTQGTIRLKEVPSSVTAILDIKDTAKVSNTAETGKKYAVYFDPTSVTAENVTSYYKKADGATVGKVYPTKKVAVAEITKDGTTKSYSTLADAVKEAVDKDTIKVVSDIDLGKVSVVIDDSKAITLDLNGKTVTYSGTGKAIELKGSVSLTVTDKSKSGNGKLSATGITIFNRGTGAVTVSGGTVEATGASSQAIFNNSTGAITISGGTMKATGASSQAIYNYGTGAITISGGTMKATGKDGYAIFNNSTGAVTVSGGTVEATGVGGNAIYNNSTGAITVSGGTVEATSIAINNVSTGKITISGTATVTSKNADSKQGTIYLMKVPAPAAILLDIQGGTVSNTANPAGYSVCFGASTVTADNLASYYKKADGATVGKVYPTKGGETPEPQGAGTIVATIVDIDGKPVTGTTVTISKNGTEIDKKAEIKDNTHTFKDLEAGTYEVRAEKDGNESNGMVAVVKGKTASITLLLTNGKALVGEDFNADYVSEVFGLEKLYLNRAKNDNEGITDADIQVIKDGGTVEVKLAATDSKNISDLTYITQEDVKLLTDKAGDTYDVLMDVRVVKVVTPKGEKSQTPVALTELNEPVTFNIDLTGRRLAGKSVNQLIVYRVHDGVESITSSNVGGEQLTLNGNMLTVSAKKFSPYMLAERKGSVNNGTRHYFSNSAGYSRYWITAEAGVGGTISPKGETQYDFGTNPVYTVTPNAGYEVDKVVIDGTKEVTLTNGTYTFKSIAEPYTIKATFKKVSSTPAPDSVNQPTTLPAAVNPATGDSIFSHLFDFLF